MPTATPVMLLSSTVKGMAVKLLFTARTTQCAAQ